MVGEIVSKDTWQYRHGDVKRIKASAAGVAPYARGTEFSCSRSSSIGLWLTFRGYI